MRSPLSRTHAARGFTLIELMVALGMALAITAAALGVMLTAVETQREGTIRNALARDAQLIVDAVGNDLQYLGVGIPRGYELEATGSNNYQPIDRSGANDIDAAGTHADKQLRPAVRIAEQDYLAFLGDLPFPNADLNGMAQPSVWVSNKHRIGFVSELSPCTPPKGGSATSGNYTCDSTQRTLVHLPGLGSACSASNITEPTCPWGMNKWLYTNGESKFHFIMGALNGGWFRRKWSTGRVKSGLDRASAHLEHWEPSYSGGDQDVPEVLFRSNRVGGGFVSTPDRVFWSLEEADGTYPCSTAPCTLRRRQCWGWASGTRPNDANFPPTAGTPIASGDDPVDCDPGASQSDGTHWESFSDNVDTLTFKYYDANNNDLGSGLTAQMLSRVRVVELTVKLAVTPPGKPYKLEQTVLRRWNLLNAGGLVTEVENEDWEQVVDTAGGCWAGGPAFECAPK